MGGELTYSSSRRLCDRGWGLLLDQTEDGAVEVIQAILGAKQKDGREGALDSGGAASAAFTGQVTPDASSIPGGVVTRLGDSAEEIRLLTKGRLLHLAQRAVAALSTGERTAFLEIFSGPQDKACSRWEPGPMGLRSLMDGTACLRSGARLGTMPILPTRPTVCN